MIEKPKTEFINGIAVTPSSGCVFADLNVTTPPDDTWWRVPGATEGAWVSRLDRVRADDKRSTFLGEFIDPANARFAALAPRMSAEIDRLREHLFHIARGDERPADIAVAALAGKEPTP